MRQRLDRDYFERLYSESSDPWSFETSEYEREKYGRTLAALGERRFHRALEVGCSIGVFTRMLAPRCDELLAVDASDFAVESAKSRLEGLENVRIERRTFPEEAPEGAFDLVVASEVLYYLPRDTMLKTLRLLEERLTSGGMLLLVHWRPETRTYPLQGEEVHSLVASNTSLSPVYSEAEPEYLLDLYGRRTFGGKS